MRYLRPLVSLSLPSALTLVVAACSSSPSSTASSGPATDLGPGDPGPGGIRFAASGEVLALTGYSFPPPDADSPAFVDGWDVKFSRLLVTVDHVTLSENPDTVPGDESQTGARVAQIDGPWAIDLAHADASYLPGKGGPGEEAVPFASLKAKSDGSSFATDGTRYAFGFDIVAANDKAKAVNLDGAASADYADMVAQGCAVLYVGTATFKGDKSDPGCYPDDHKTWPDVVNFKFCFKSPTTYANCQNPDNDPAKALGDEEHERGIAFKENASVLAQLTVHTDHPFWDSVIHDSPAHFDQFAARVAGEPSPASVTLDDVKGVDYTAYTDKDGKPVSWRYCIAPPTDAHGMFSGPMAFDPESVPHATGGDGASGLRDYYDFAVYDQSTQGHLNSDGLCSVMRNYPSPL